MLLKFHPASYLPRQLSREETENPSLFLTTLGGRPGWLACRKRMDYCLLLAINGDYHKQSRRQRAELLSFYTTLEKVIETAHLLYCRDQLTNLEYYLPAKHIASK